MALSEDYELHIRQGPERARVAGVKEKDRKPVDPPPIIQLRIKDDSDPAQNYLQSPYYFMCCNLYDPLHEQPATSAPHTALAGTLVSSLHRLKDIDNSDGGFFVFGDLSVKLEGEFRLRFSLFEMLKKRPAPTALRPDEYSSRPYPPPIPPEHRSPLTHAQPGGSSYARSPTGEYRPYGEPAKRQKTSLDASLHHPPREWQQYERADLQYAPRPYHDQQSSYSTFPPQNPPPPNYVMNFPAAPHSAPAGMPDYSYRHPQPGQTHSPSVSSPYGSPRSQITQRSPGGPSKYQVQPYSAQQINRNHNVPPASMQVPNITEPSPPRRQQTYQQPIPPGPPLQSPSTLPLASPGMTRSPDQSRYGTSSYASNLPSSPMPPPNPSHRPQSSQPFNLPPLLPSAPLNPGIPMSTGPPGPSHLPLTSAPPPPPPLPPTIAGQSGYVPGPPTSFDSAAQQTSQPPQAS
ncbi:hypothetical protein FGG08_001340 [Glutinoglossum americanum]|uniref:Velvet domain-containing protein n=1 Tax=Glutinoglossum americanum TaxID=1670608 RepID=A0A9P8IH20_9PEZI|nr:hypothetical protein FGG08_001340 [Glutinoglossum americanum]